MIGRLGKLGSPNSSDQSAKRARRAARGYTLLEVLVALAILATAMTVLMGTMANNGQQAQFSNQLTVASLLARGKMIDLEYELMREGLSTSNQKLSGTFNKEGYPDFRWEADVQIVEIPEAAREELLARINSQLFGGVDQEGALKGNAAFSSMLPVLIGRLPDMINRIGEKVRRVQLTVEFPYGGRTYPMSVTQYIIDHQSAEFSLFEAQGGPTP